MNKSNNLDISIIEKSKESLNSFENNDTMRMFVSENPISYPNNLLISETIFRNSFAKEPKALALSILVKTRYGSSVVYGASYHSIANKLKIDEKTLLKCLESDVAGDLFSIKKRRSKEGEGKIYLKAHKLYARGKNIVIDVKGGDYFDSRHMKLGLGDKITLKTITDKLYIVQAVLCAHRQGGSIHANYGGLKLALPKGTNNRECESSKKDSDMSSVTFTGCSIETFSQKLRTSKYKTRKILNEAHRLGAITKRIRKVVYQASPTGLRDAVQIKEGGKFVITYANGKTMEQLSNEYHTGRIKFKRIDGKSRRLKDGRVVRGHDIKKRKASGKGKMKNHWIPFRPDLIEEAIWKPTEGLSIPDIVDGKVVKVKTTDNLPGYVRTDLIKEHIKCLKKSKKSELKAAAKQMLQSLSSEEVFLPYKKDKSKMKGKTAYIKMLESIRRSAADYAFTKRRYYSNDYIDASMDKYVEGCCRTYEVVSFIMDLKKFQKKANNEVKKLNTEHGCNLFFVNINDAFVDGIIKEMSEDDSMLDKVNEASVPLFKQFMIKRERMMNDKEEKVEITVEAIWRWLACSGKLDKYIYDKKVDLELKSDVVLFKEYIMVETKRNIGDVAVGTYG